MRKFFTLLKKELRELITPIVIVPLLITIPMFAIVGQVVENAGESEKDGGIQTNLAFIDKDNSILSGKITNFLGENFNITKLDNQDISLNDSILIIIPEKFEKNLKKSTKPELQIYTAIKGFSILAYAKIGLVDNIKMVLTDFISDEIILQKTGLKNSEFLKNPLEFEDFVQINEKQAKIEPAAVIGFVESKSVFIPVILMIVIIFSAQMVAVAIASEKENKTLEILLSSPVSRKSIIFAKISAAAIVALLFSLIYGLAFYFFLGNLTATSTGTETVTMNTLQELGLIFNNFDYFLIAFSLFTATLCGLGIAIIFGILAEDVKGIQIVVAPLAILVIIPYILVLFLDLDSISDILKYIIYLIPFSHPFLSIQKLILDQQQFVIYGILYQTLVAILLIIIAAKIFSSDKILTMNLNFFKKKK